MYNFPQDPTKIRARMRRYERALRREQASYGFINDGGGKRYLLGPLYLLLGDTAGALQSFTWFAQTFPDDSGDPLHSLCWTLALYRAGELEHATVKLRQTMLSNLYLLPRLLGMAQEHIDMWYPSNRADKAYSEGIPDAVLALWEPAALHWAYTVYMSAPMQRVRRRSIAIYHQLKTEPVGPTRSRLVAEAFRLCQIQSLVRLVGRKINTLQGLCTIIAETDVQSSVRAVVIFTIIAETDLHFP